MAGIETDEASGRALPPFTVEAGQTSLQDIADKKVVANGYHRSEGSFGGENPSITLVRINGNQPGFKPDETITSDKNISPNGWYGKLLDTHANKIDLTISQRFDESNDEKTFITSKRDTLLKFNDTSSDYLLHGFQIKNKPMSGDGITYKKDKNTPFENNDPVIYGFEVIVDSVSSPLLNGSVEDFIKQFSVISEIQSRQPIIKEFKQQFIKLFKTNYSVRGITQSDTQQSSIVDNGGELSKYANSVSQKNQFRPGKTAYMSYYMQKISGLSKLVESNTSGTKKYLAEYRKDLITLSFLEDVSATMGTLSQLYKLLYWSKPNGKGLVPENLLRFNCDIIVSECRNFNRVREAMDSGNLEIIKDNVSRYIYSLKECQLFFDKMPHDDAIDMGAIKAFETHEVSFDYKYSTLKFERWMSDKARFGNYVGYNDGSIWRRYSTLGTELPKFYTNGTINDKKYANTLKQQGVMDAEILRKVGPYTENKQEIMNSVSSSTQSTPGITEMKAESMGKKLAKKAANFAISEVNNQINLRKRLLNDTINKIRNAFGLGGLKTEPKRVYPKPYTPHSFGIFFDVRNDLYNFLGEEVSSIIQGGANVIDPTREPGGNYKINPFKGGWGKGRNIYKSNVDQTKNTLGAISKRFGKR
jgi:hypothetical protein